MISLTRTVKVYNECEKTLILLTILDGWGYSDEVDGNAIALANTPNFDEMWDKLPRCFIKTSGSAVGLPEGQMGNSEVGHTTIGAGRIIFQDLPRISNSFKNGEFEQINTVKNSISYLKSQKKTAHIFGLVSDGGVHSHIDHLIDLQNILCKESIQVIIHAVTDGRDTPPGSASHFIEEMENSLGASARIGTVSGRYYSMDRDKRWDRTEISYDAIVSGAGTNAISAKECIESSYSDNISDEFIRPCVIGDYSGVNDGDVFFCANFRPDRAKQILQSICLKDFKGFQRKEVPCDHHVIGFRDYGTELKEGVDVIFSNQDITDTLGEIISARKLKQLRISETEKFAHITYFFNGGIEKEFLFEDRELIPSPKVDTYDLKPEMSLPEVTTKLLSAIRSKEYDFILLNIANPDMVGHTGNITATIKALESVDTSLGLLIDAIKETNAHMLITADHGNCEMMINKITGEPHTSHTVFDVPLLVHSSKVRALKNGGLADIAPTILDIMDIDIPDNMTGKSLRV